MSTLFDITGNNQIRANTLRLALIKHRGDIMKDQQEFKLWEEAEYVRSVQEIDRLLHYIDQAVTDKVPLEVNAAYPLPEIDKTYGEWKVLRIQNGLVVALNFKDEATEWVLDIAEFWRKVK